MSRAFLRDDAEGEMPRRHYDLPARDDPGFDGAAARALLEAARVNETQLAERATGYYWGEPRLRPFVEKILVEADLFDTHAPPPAAPSPANRSLLNEVRQLKIDVERIAPIHGTPTTWADFLRAVGAGAP